MGSKSAIGIGNGICFKQVRDKGGGSYIDPLVCDSIVGLWKFDQNTNESPTRNIIKNTIKDKGGDLELLNFAYKANSGYNGYSEDFTSWKNSSHLQVEYSTDGSKFKITSENIKDWWLIVPNSGISNSFKVKITNCHFPIIWRYTDDGNTYKDITISEDGIYNLPQSIINNEGVVNRCCFGSGTQRNDYTGLTIEQLPLYEGALVTDGKDDMIVSQKTVQEMGIADEITVVSMIHQININSTYNKAFNNYLEVIDGSAYVRNEVVNDGKTGIYGYTSKLSTNVSSVINNILGDKKDYLSSSTNISNSLSNTKFSVTGRISKLNEISSVACYWTFVSNKVLTTDEINQIIAYFKLDKYVTPQVIYDVKRQGLTNDTPAADWYLKDFSGNGHDMTLYNFAKKLGSGIGKYAEDFTSWKVDMGLKITRTSSTVNLRTKINSKVNFWALRTENTVISAMKVKITGITPTTVEDLIYRYNGVNGYINIPSDGVYEFPETKGVSWEGFRIIGTNINITITQIPDYEGALVSDGKDDYGHADNLPIFKDYTVAIDRAWIGSLDKNQCLATKNPDSNWGAFNFELLEGTTKNTYSFGEVNNNVSFDTNRKISYQSKYSYNGSAINMGNASDGKDLFLFRSRSAFPYYAEAAIWSYLLFPYSLSEFLLERQLKKYKLGTLYPDMIEWRPIAKSNIPYKQIDYFIKRSSTYVRLNPGGYFQSTEDIIVRVTPIRDWQLDVVSSIKVNEKNEVISVNSSYAQTAPIHIDKSPQKIDITIDEYIRYEDIVQPYPAIINLKQDGKTITWGDKLKVGSEVTFVNHTNLLPDLYTVSGGVQYNGTFIFWNTSIKVEKSMVFVNPHSYNKTNEPNCILAPQTLRIPNSSYKILGYIPDLTGKGNHGRLNNFAYTEESGANEDGSIRFDGTDDHIIIPTIKHGGKALLMKVNWRYKNNIAMVYDQRIKWRGFGISISRDQLPSVAYKPYNKVTYIDGIKNESVLVQDLEGITHNITGIYDNLDLSDERDVCISRTSDASNSGFADMSMYEFMLFPDVPDEEEIKELNDIVGIEGGYVESPDYYWDAYGKKNTDADRNLIADQVSKDVANALEIKNVGYNSESGYTDDNGLLLDGIEDHAVNTVIPAVTDFTVIGKRTDLRVTNQTTFFIQKGLLKGWNGGGAFSDGHYEGSAYYCSSFGKTNDITSVYNKEFFYQTPTNYNGVPINIGDKVDSNGLIIGAGILPTGDIVGYYEGVFYKAMLYTKTIDQLSINTLKNMFERDELIDVTNPIFKKKEL